MELANPGMPGFTQLPKNGPGIRNGAGHHILNGVGVPAQGKAAVGDEPVQAERRHVVLASGQALSSSERLGKETELDSCR
jgi:hypothetical protein